MNETLNLHKIRAQVFLYINYTIKAFRIELHEFFKAVVIPLGPLLHEEVINHSMNFRKLCEMWPTEMTFQSRKKMKVTGHEIWRVWRMWKNFVIHTSGAELQWHGWHGTAHHHAKELTFQGQPATLNISSK